MTQLTADSTPLFDYAVIGAGIAGASVAYHLARHGSVILIERESQPGYHSTGRSAAMFMETYGTQAIQALTRASRDFYQHPPEGFTEHPLLAPRGVLYIADHEQKDLLHSIHNTLSSNAPNVRLINAQEALALVPVLKADTLYGAIMEEDAQDIDVHALLQGYIHGMRERGAILKTNAELAAAIRENSKWMLTLADGSVIQARHLVNSAGAWADAVAALCGVQPIGLEPRRRSAFTFAAPEGLDCARWPAVVGIDESFYFKPDAGQLLGSPANADPVSAHDVVAEEYDVALGIHHIENATTLTITRPRHTWAGLRSFVPDGNFSIGWESSAEGYFWLAAQGGYGIQTAAATAELACALLRGQPVPQRLIEQGFDLASVDPERFR